MKTSLQIIICLFFITSTLQNYCSEINLATKEICTKAEVTLGYYKCCYYKGKIDLVSTGEKVLSVLSGNTKVENEIITYCVELTEDDYKDINKYIKEHKNKTIDGTTIKFDEVTIDCFCNYHKVTFWILFVFSLLII